MFINICTILKMVEVVPQVPARCDTAVKLHRNLFLNNLILCYLEILVFRLTLDILIQNIIDSILYEINHNIQVK